VPGCTASPSSSSRPTAAFASQLLLLTCRAISAPPPPRESRPACIRAAPSAAISSTASDQCVVHHYSWLHFSCGQHFVEHLNCVLDTATVFPHLAQKLSTTTPPARAWSPATAWSPSRTASLPALLAPAHAVVRCSCSCVARVPLTRLLHASRTPVQCPRQPLRAPAPPVPAARAAAAPARACACACSSARARSALAPAPRSGAAPPLAQRRLRSPEPRALARVPASSRRLEPRRLLPLRPSRSRACRRTRAVAPPARRRSGPPA
jgi:hypothetical protein